MTGQWKTIESAPKDETPVLVYGNWEGEISYTTKNGPDKGPAWCVATSRNGSYWSAVHADYYSVVCVDATAWMPLPDPPAGPHLK